MEIGKYKQAMSYLLNQNATTKTFTLNPNAKLSDNDPNFIEGGRVGLADGGLSLKGRKIAKIVYGLKDSEINSLKNKDTEIDNSIQDLISKNTTLTDNVKVLNREIDENTIN